MNLGHKDIMKSWQFVKITVLQYEVMTLGQCDNMSVWHYDIVTWLQCDSKTYWQCDSTLALKYDNVTLWLCDSMTVWQYEFGTIWQCDNKKLWPQCTSASRWQYARAILKPVESPYELFLCEPFRVWLGRSCSWGLVVGVFVAVVITLLVVHIWRSQ